ncbi:MAG: hypothetical protein ABR577_07625 [Pyrinomonadaceae bacterium]
MNWRTTLLVLAWLTLAAQILFAFFMVVAAIMARDTSIALPGLGLIIAGPLFFIMLLIVDLVVAAFVLMAIAWLRRSARLP